MHEYNTGSPPNAAAAATSSSVPAKPTKAKQQPSKTAEQGLLPQRNGKFGRKRVYQDAVVPHETRESVVEKDVAEEGF